MTPLRKTAEVSRLIIKWGAVFLVVMMVGRLVIGGTIRWYKQRFPKIPAPTIGFGILPPIAFPEQEAKTLTYRLETIDGYLPSLPTQAEVLFMPISRPNLLAMEKSQATATVLGLKTEPEKVSDTSYRWRTSAPIPTSLTISIYDGRFIWKTEWSADPNFLATKNLSNEAKAKKEVLDLVRKIDADIKDIGEKEMTVDYLKAAAGSYQPTTSLTEADFVRVNVFRKPYLDKYQFVTADPSTGIVKVILSGNPKAGKFVQMLFTYFPVNYESVETYPLRPIDQAWQELQQGKGFVASVDPGVTEVVVRRVTMGYFDSYEPQQYMQPVYIFTGDSNFVGYVQAVKDPKTSQSE